MALAGRGLWFLARKEGQGIDARLLDAAFFIIIVSLLGAKLIRSSATCPIT
jgi:hypothetical protein